MQPAFLLLPVVVSKKPAFSSHKIDKFQRQEFEKKVSEKDSVRQITKWINNLCEKEKKLWRKRNALFVEVLYYSVSSLFISLFQIQDVELKRNPFYLEKRENIDIAACFENVEMTTQKGDLLFCFFFCLLKIMIKNWYLKV